MNKPIYNLLRGRPDVAHTLLASLKNYGLVVLLGLFAFLVPMQAQTGAALSFDGSNDHVAFPSNGLSAAAGTVEFWVNTVSNGSTQMYIDLAQEQFTIYSVGNSLRARIAGTDLSATFTPNQWNHLALTWSGNGTTARLYLNGVQVASGTQGATPMGTTTGYLSRSQSVGSYFVSCTMDEVRLWNVARTAAQILANYQCEVPTNSSGLQNYYKFNQGVAAGNNSSITSLTDATANARHGSLVNFALTGSTSNWVTSTTINSQVTPSVSIAAAPSGSVVYGSSVTFTATPTHGGTTPSYQWKKNGTNVGTNSTTYTDATLNNGDVISCVLTSNAACITTTTATSNSLTMAVTFPAGAALNFDGINDYITLPALLPIGSGSVTFECMVKVPTVGTGNLVAGERVGILLGNYNNINSNEVNFEINDGGFPRLYWNSGNVNLIGTTNLRDNQWHHLAFVRDKEQNQCRIYVDGVLNVSHPSAGTDVVLSQLHRIGADNRATSFYFHGSMDEIRLWGRALPLCEVQNNRTCELGSNQTQLLAYYKLNQGSGFTSNASTTSLTDDSGNNRTGTLTNFALTGTASNWIASGGITTGTTCTPLATPSVSITASTSTVCVGASVTFTAVGTNGGTAPQYQWFKNGVAISGATNATYTSAILANNDTITCVLTSNAACPSTPTATSNSLVMTVTPLVTPSVAISITTGASTICAGTSVTFTAVGTNGGTTPQYQWFKNSIAVLGATNATYTSASLANGDEISCVLTNTETCVSTATATSNLLTITVTVPIGAALDFDGVNDHATAPAAVYFNGDFTIESWVYLKSYASWSRVIDFGNGRNIDNVILTVTNGDGGAPEFHTRNQYFRANRSLPLNTWSHLAVTVKGKLLTFYINGVNAGTAVINTPPANVVRNVCYIGRSHWFENAYANMRMDELRIWNRSLLQCEIQNNMNCELDNGQTGLQLYYKFNQGIINGNNAGTTTLTDASGNNRTGAIVNFGLTGTASNWIAKGGVITGTTCTPVTVLTPTLTIAGTPSGQIVAGTSVTFTAIGTNGGTAPVYQWKKNNVNVGTNSTTYTDAALANNDVISCVMTSSEACATSLTATSNALTLSVNGNAPASALNLDGVNDYVSIPYNAALNPNQFSFQTWVNVKGGAGTYRAVLSSRSNNGGEGGYIVYAGPDNKWQFWTGAGAGQAWNYLLTNETVQLNQWVNLSGTYDGTTMRFYINGVLKGSLVPRNVVYNTSLPLLLGAGSNEGPYLFYLNGDIDNTSIWNRALSQCEIQNNMNGELGTGQTGLVAYYKFNQGNVAGNNAAITTVADASGNGYNGTLNGLALTGTTSNWVSGGAVAVGTTVPTYTPPSVSVNNVTACIGTTANLTATPTSLAANTAYQWEISTNNSTWSDVAGATALTYTPSTSAVGTRYFRVKATDACGTVYSAGQTFTVTNPNLTVSATAIQACQNTTATFTAATTSGTPTYQWQSSPDRLNWTNMSSETAATLTPSTATVGTAYYRVIGTYSGGCVLTSAPQTLVVVAAPMASVTGGNLSVPMGNTTTTLRAVINTPFPAVFQWQSSADGSTGWTDIANSNTLSYKPLTTTVGTVYYRLKVTFSNSKALCHTVIYSNIRSLTVEAAPVVTISASNGAITNSTIYCVGSDITFTSSCSNATATPYWVGPNGFTASTANITLSNLNATHEGVYKVTYVTQTGNSGEQSVTVKVSPELAVNKTVTAQDIIQGTSSRITIVDGYKKGILGKIDHGADKVLTVSTLTEGAAPVYAANDDTQSQQWWFIPVSGSTLDLSPTTSQRFYIQSVKNGLYLKSNPNNPAVLELGTFSTGSNIQWYMASGAGQTSTGLKARYNRLSNGAGYFLNSDAIQLNAPLTLMSRHTNVAARPSDLTLSWENNSTSAIRVVTPSATTDYIATFTTPLGCIFKDTTTVRVYAAPTVAVVPTATGVCQGQSVSLSAAVTGNVGTATYQWQSSTNNTTWVNISGATATDYTVPTAAISNIYYRVILTNTLGTFTANSVAIAVTQAPTAAISASQTEACLNTAITLTANYSSGFGTASVQWQSSPDSSVWTNISSATADTYQPPTHSNGIVYYRYTVGLSASCFPVIQSKGVAITVNSTLTAQISGVPTQSVCRGTYRVFTLTTNATNPTYVWQSSPNGTAWTTIADATSAHFIVPTNAVGTMFYRAIITSDCNAISPMRQVTVTQAPEIVVGSPVTATCLDRPVAFTASVVAGNIGFIKGCIWETSKDNLNWTRQPGLGKTAFTPNVATLGTTYVRVGAKLPGCVDSSYAVSKSLTVISNPTVVLPANLSACGNSTLSIQPPVSVGVGTQTYQWESQTTGRTRLGWQTVSGATNANLSLAMGSLQDDKWKYRLKINYGNYCPESYSTEVVVNRIQSPSVAVTAVSGTNICQNSEVTLRATVVANTAYQWQSSPDGTTWTDITGATASTYTYNATTLGTLQYRVSALTNFCAAVNSAPVTITVGINTNPTLALTANNATLCGPTDVTITATPASIGGATPQYVWRRNGRAFVGQPTNFVTRTTANGLGSNVINDIAVVGDRVYVATTNGLAISTDGGATFINKTTAHGLPSNNITALGLHPNGINLMVGTDKGPITTNDGGATFVESNISKSSNSAVTSAVTSIGIAPSDYQIYISFADGQIYRDKFNTIRTIDYSGSTTPANAINFKNGSELYFWTNNGLTNVSESSAVRPLQFSGSSVPALPYKRSVLKKDTMYTINSRTGFGYIVNGQMNAGSGLPTTNLEDVIVNDNTVYVTGAAGLFMSKDGGKTFSDITPTTNLGANPGLKRLVLGANNIYMAGRDGLKISTTDLPTLTLSTNKSDVIECVMTTTNGVCTNVTKQSLTLNYIADVDPLSIQVAVDGTTGAATWGAVSGAAGYGWELMKFSPDRSSKTFVKNGTTATNNVSLTDLNPSSNYELTVKTLCNLTPTTNFSRLSNVTGAGSGGSTSFTTGFVVPQSIKDILVRASTLCAEDALVLGPDFPEGYQVNIYSGTDKTYIDYASAAHPFTVNLASNTKYFYKVLKIETKKYTFTASNNDPGTESKRYTVPTGVTRIDFKVAGSKGGGPYGGKGGITTGTLVPTVGTAYYLFPGTLTTSDAGLSRGTDKSVNGGGGSYVSLTNLRKDAILVGGGGGSSGFQSFQEGGNGGRVATGTISLVKGGTATTGGTSAPALNSNTTAALRVLIGQVIQSGFMKGASTNNIASTLRKADYAGGGGYYGGGAFIETTTLNKYAGGGGGSSYANPTLIGSPFYEDGANNELGYITVTEYYQATANSDFLPLDIVVMPVPSLSNASITLNPTVLTRGQNYTANFNMSGNSGFETSYFWYGGGSTKTITATTPNWFNYIYSGTVNATATVKYCSGRTKTIGASVTYQLTPAAGGGTDTGAVLSGANLMPTVNLNVSASATSICQGEQVVFTATADGLTNGNVYYIWRKNGVEIPSEFSEVLETQSLTQGDIITCQVFYPVGNNGERDSVMAAPITMSVTTPARPSVSIAASTNNVCPGTPITFTPTPTAGGTAPQYQWYLNGDYVETSPTFTSTNFANNDYVECIMSSNAACITQTESEISPNVSIQMKDAASPTAMVFVTDTLICAGGPANFAVQVQNAGATPQYQWRHNGAPVGNDVTYTALSVTHNDAIWCDVTPSADVCGSTNTIQSNTELVQTAASDAVFTPMVAIAMGQDSICATDSLIVLASGNYLGSDPYFVWKKNGVAFDSTSNTLALHGLVDGDLISCVATSNLGCVTTPEAESNVLAVKVYAPKTPAVVISTPNTVICPNEYVVISAAPTYGGLMPQYNWRLNNAAYNALPHQFFNYTTSEGLAGDYVQTVFVRNDTAYAATVGGLSYTVAGDSLITKTIDDGLLSSNVTAVFADDSGVYVGTDKGLSISTDGLNSFRPINTTLSGLSSESVTAITAIGSTLFVGTDNGLNISTDGGESFITKNTTHGLGANRINHLFVDGSKLYVGTEGGLSISTDNGVSFVTKTTVDSLNSDTVWGVWAKNALVYAATEQGLAVSTDNGTTFTKITIDNGLPHPQVNGVWGVTDSIVYIATSGGLGISKNGGLSFRTYSDADSLGSNTVFAVTVANSRIYAATEGGLSISDPSKIRVYPNNGDVFSTHLSSNDVGCLTTLAAVSNNLTFSVAAVDAASLTAEYIGNTVATITWTGTPSSYNWRVVPTGTGLDGALVASGNNTATGLAALTGLTPLTTYDVYIQGACNPNGTVDWIGPMTFTTKNDVFVAAKTILQGAYNASTGLMGDNLRALNLVPTTEPYTDLSGFTHVGGGAEKISASVLSVTGNDAIVDWVFVELRDKNTPSTVIATRAALIQRDGDVVDVDGISPVGFPVAADAYYIVVRHRNHLGVRTTATVDLNTAMATSYDFTSAAAQALDGIQKDLTDGKFGMYGGNVNGNNTVRASGSLTVNDYLRLINLLGTSSNILSNVYSLGDVNLDGTVRASGSLTVNDYLRIINAIGNSAAIIVQPF